MSSNTNEYNKAYYESNRKKRIAQIRVSREAQRERNRNSLREYLQNSLCADCGNVDWRVLQLDHVGKDKKLEVTLMVSRGYKWDTIQKEIAKCEVVCANCHIIRTGSRGNWWRFHKPE